MNLKVLKLELKAGKNMTIKYLEDEERESKTKSGAVKLTTQNNIGGVNTQALMGLN